MGVHVYVSPGTNPAQLARMQNLGAEVTVDDADPGQAARVDAAAHPGCVRANNHLPGATLATVLTGTDPASRLLAEALQDRGTRR